MIFPNGRKAAISYTFDDGTLDHLSQAEPMLRAHEIRATFYVMPGLVAVKRYTAAWTDEHGNPKATERLLMRWRDLRLLASQGHEIANHSLSHKRMWTIADEAALEHEVRRSLRILNERLGKQDRSWAWPYMKGHPKAMTLVSELHTGIRPVPGTHVWTERVGLERANGWIDKAIKFGGWWFMCIHEIGRTGVKTRPQILEPNMAYAKDHEDEIWIAPVCDVARWMRKHK